MMHNMTGETSKPIIWASIRLTKRRIQLFSILSFIFLASWSCGMPEDWKSKIGKPHPVIIIDIDTLRADHLGCYGARRDTSPTIDRLASEGLLFEWAFAQAPFTSPSQSSILTGLYPRSHGRISKKDILAEKVTTLAEVMRDSGFMTAGFVDGGFMAPRWGIGQGFKKYVCRPQRQQGLAALGPRAIEWVRQNAEKDFLLLIHTYDVHASYDPPPHFGRFFSTVSDLPRPVSNQMQRP